MKHNLEWMAQAAPVMAPQHVVAPPAKKLRLWQDAAALLALAVIGVAGWMLWLQPAPPTEISRFVVPLP